MAASQSCADLSSLTVATVLPSGLKAAIDLARCDMTSQIILPVTALHNRALPSKPPVKIVWPSGLNDRLLLDDNGDGPAERVLEFGKRRRRSDGPFLGGR